METKESVKHVVVKEFRDPIYFDNKICTSTSMHRTAEEAEKVRLYNNLIHKGSTSSVHELRMITNSDGNGFTIRYRGFTITGTDINKPVLITKDGEDENFNSYSVLEGLSFVDHYHIKEREGE